MGRAFTHPEVGVVSGANSVLASSPSGDATGVTDRARLQAELTSLGNGGHLVVSNSSDNPYYLDAPLVYRNGQQILGQGPAKRGACMFKQAPGKNFVPPGTPTLNGRGVWVSATSYAVNDAVLVAIQEEGIAYTNANQRGNFAGSTAYAVNDVVFNPSGDNLVYVCVAAYTSSASTPDTDATHWMQIATQLYRCISAVSGTTNPISDSGHWTVVGPCGLLIPYEWANNQNFDGQASIIENIALDGNRTQNPYSTACGVVTQNFWTDVRRCLIQNMPSSGILQTDTTANGTTITSSSSENRIYENKILQCTLHGVRSTNASNTTNQDGYCEENQVSQCCGSGILYDRASGWKIRANHLYNIGMHGIFAQNTWSSYVNDNYVEDFGGQCATGYFYQGVGIVQLLGRASWVKDNLIGCFERNFNVVGNYQYLVITAGTSQTDCNVTCTTNHVLGGSRTKGLGVVYQLRSGATLRIKGNDNHVEQVNTTSFIQSGVKIVKTDSAGREHSTAGATTAAFNSTNGNQSALAAGSNDLYGQIQCGTPASVAAGPMVGLTFEQSFAATPAVSFTPANAATAALGVPYTSAGSGAAVTLAVPVAPSASAAAGTYAWNYMVGA